MALFSVDRLTIYNGFDAWEAQHFAGLYDKKRYGRPPKLIDEEQNKAHYYLEQHPRDIRKVVHLLEQDTSKRVSPKTIKRLVKKPLGLEAYQKGSREALIHSNTSTVKHSSNGCKIKNLTASVTYGILMAVVFA